MTRAHSFYTSARATRIAPEMALRTRGSIRVSDDPQYEDLLAELQSKLRAWQEETKDPWTVKYRYE